MKNLCILKSLFSEEKKKKQFAQKDRNAVLDTQIYHFVTETPKKKRKKKIETKERKEKQEEKRKEEEKKKEKKRSGGKGNISSCSERGPRGKEMEFCQG